VYADSSYCQVGCTGNQMEPHYSISQKSAFSVGWAIYKKKPIAHPRYKFIYELKSHISQYIQITYQ